MSPVVTLLQQRVDGNMKNLSSIKIIRINLEKILKDRDISYNDFSKILRMDRSNVRKHIKGSRSISLNLLDKFSKALDISPKDLLSRGRLND